MKKRSPKLVRDNIPEIIRVYEGQCRFRIAPQKKLSSFLEKKMREELRELLGAVSQNDIEKESADLIEAIIAYAESKGATEDEINHTRVVRRVERGAFNKGKF